jgi:hypothetical protein
VLPTVLPLSSVAISICKRVYTLLVLYNTRFSGFGRRGVVRGRERGRAEGGRSGWQGEKKKERKRERESKRRGEERRGEERRERDPMKR